MDTLLKRQGVHHDVMELSRHEPPVLLKQALVINSNRVCQDCDMSKKRVKDYFRSDIVI